MRNQRPRRRPVWTVVLALTTLLVGGCTTGPVDRAGGGAVRDVRVLSFGQFGVTPGPALEAWAGQVTTLSGGSLRVEFKNEWRNGTADFETGTVEDVRVGKLDVAVVGARVFDRLGVTSFHALLAPLLVDSHALQARVFAAGIPDEMANRLEPAGVVSLGTLPGPMRKMLGVSKPYVRPTDFAGAVVGIQDSALAARTLTALGAVPEVVGPGVSLDGLDGYEQQLGSIVGNHYADAAKYVTANLDLWPRPQVIVTSPRLLASLSPEGRRALQQAVQVARPVAEQTVQQEVESSVAPLCRDGMTLPAASAEDLQEITTALEPVLRELTAEPGTGSWLQQIRALKAQVGAPPDASSCGQRSTDSAVSQLDGTYERIVVGGEAVPGCPANDQTAGPGAGSRLVFHNGTVQEFGLSGVPGASPDLGWNGAYHVFRDRISLGEPGTDGAFTVAWALRGKQLTLSDMKPFTCGDANVWIVRPWQRVS